MARRIDPTRGRGMTDSTEERLGASPSTQPLAARTDLARLVAAARQDPLGTLELMLRRAELAQAAFERASGKEHLLFVCAEVACALPLTALREVLLSVPRAVPLP